jgi:hypothetical protein
METEEISETLHFNSTLTRLIAREDFSAFIRRESFKSYSTEQIFMSPVVPVSQYEFQVNLTRQAAHQSDKYMELGNRKYKHSIMRPRV